jgi:hypothetical protein
MCTTGSRSPSPTHALCDTCAGLHGSNICVREFSHWPAGSNYSSTHCGYALFLLERPYRCIVAAGRPSQPEGQPAFSLRPVSAISCIIIIVMLSWSTQRAHRTRGMSGNSPKCVKSPRLAGLCGISRIALLNLHSSVITLHAKVRLSSSRSIFRLCGSFSRASTPRVRLG